MPEYLDNLGLCDDRLDTHIACDIGARQVAIQLSELFNAPLILGIYSRLVIDLNRRLDDPTLILELSDQIPVPGNRNLGDADRKQRINRFFHPYHDQYSELVSHMRKKHSDPVIISVHSFTPCMDNSSRPWHFGVLRDQDDILGRYLLSAFTKLPGWIIGDNQPYHANHPQGYAHQVYARERGVAMAMLEIRQDLITRPQDQAAIAQLVYQATNSAIREYLNRLQYG